MRSKSGYPSDHLQMPPSCSARSGFIITQMWNEAAQNIPGVADLASGEFGVRLRRKKGEDAWDRVDGLTVGDLVREAVRGPDSER